MAKTFGASGAPREFTKALEQVAAGRKAAEKQLEVYRDELTRRLGNAFEYTDEYDRIVQRLVAGNTSTRAAIDSVLGIIGREVDVDDLPTKPFGDGSGGGYW
jgi:hypothetical protein